MPKYRHLELLSRGPVSRVRLLNHRPFCPEDVAELTCEWNCVADRADCQVLFVDCSNIQRLNSEMLSKLILLQRRLKHKEGKLILHGMRPEVRELLRWTKLDRVLEIKEDERPEIAAPA